MKEEIVTEKGVGKVLEVFLIVAAVLGFVAAFIKGFFEEYMG